MLLYSLRLVRMSRFLVALLIIGWTGLASAVEMTALYEARVPAPVGVEQTQLLKSVFTEVLVKVSGRSDIVSHASYESMLAQADMLVQQFRFEADYNPPSLIQAPATEENTVQKAYWASFERQGVNRLLTESGINVWGNVRPSTLIWFARETGQGREMPARHEMYDIVTVFEDQAAIRGIPVIFPFMDLQDQSKVSVSDIWGNFMDAVKAASVRYQPQTIAIVKLYQGPGQSWSSEWMVDFLGSQHRWSLRDNDQEFLLREGINRLTDTLALRYTRSGVEANKNTLILRVNNVASFRDFERTNEYLASISAISKLQVLKTAEDRVLFSIELQSDRDALEQSIRYGDVLETVESTRPGIDDVEGQSFKPVILDNVDNPSQRAQALDNVEKSAAPEQAGQINGMHEQPNTADNLQVDLDYWLIK